MDEILVSTRRVTAPFGEEPTTPYDLSCRSTARRRCANREPWRRSSAQGIWCWTWRVRSALLRKQGLMVEGRDGSNETPGVTRRPCAGERHQSDDSGRDPAGDHQAQPGHSRCSMSAPGTCWSTPARTTITSSTKFFSGAGLRRPDHFLGRWRASVAERSATSSTELTGSWRGREPDAFLTLGDTNSCLCVIAAKRRKIPVFHMEAGNRCFDQRVPEELNRRIMDHQLTSICRLTEHARRYFLRRGECARDGDQDRFDDAGSARVSP